MEQCQACLEFALCLPRCKSLVRNRRHPPQHLREQFRDSVLPVELRSEIDIDFVCPRLVLVNTQMRVLGTYFNRLVKCIRIYSL